MKDKETILKHLADANNMLSLPLSVLEEMGTLHVSENDIRDAVRCVKEAANNIKKVQKLLENK